MSQSAEISCKVWRNTGEKWFQQPKELPVHRVIDQAALICTAIRHSENGNKLTTTDDFQITFSTDNDYLKRYLEIMKKELATNKEHLDESLDRQVRALKKIGKFEMSAVGPRFASRWRGGKSRAPITYITTHSLDRLHPSAPS